MTFAMIEGWCVFWTGRKVGVAETTSVMGSDGGTVGGAVAAGFGSQAISMQTSARQTTMWDLTVASIENSDPTTLNTGGEETRD
jgi:hypothetical protein